MKTSPESDICRRHKNSILKRTASLFLVFVMMIGAIAFTPVGDNYFGTGVYAASTDATGLINAEGGACLRKSTSTSSKSITTLGYQTQVTVLDEVFLKNTSTSKKTRWYHVSVSGKTGYVRADLVDVTYPSLKAITTATVNYRKGPATTFEKYGTLSEGKSLRVKLVATVSGDSKIWYRARINKKTCYISGDYVRIKSSNSTTATTAAAAAVTTTKAASTATKSSTSSSGTVKVSSKNVRTPTTLYTGSGFSIMGTIKCNTDISKVTVGVTDTSDNWVISKTLSVGSTSFDISDADSYIKFGTLNSGDYNYRIDVYVGKKCTTEVNSPFTVMASEVAAKLLAKATTGGKARTVYTFNKSNCTRLFGIKGRGSAVVPQGMAFTGEKYYIIYGMSNSQAIVTYSASGKRLSSCKFPFNMGHPNGITWDPVTGKCYIFKGNQYSCYSWDPDTKKFSKVKTPYSSSGIAYDNSTGLLYSSSKSGIRVYSADGKFKQSKVINRCSRGGTNYVQDCGAANGYIFHGVSGANKHKTNYLDVYREADSKYLGTIKINIDEIEGATVDNNGFVILLCNTTSKTDYLWKTPLNVNDLA